MIACVSALPPLLLARFAVKVPCGRDSTVLPRARKCKGKANVVVAWAQAAGRAAKGCRFASSMQC